MHTLFCVNTVQGSVGARAPVRRTFLKLLNKDGNFKVCIYRLCTYACTKMEAQKFSQDYSEHVKISTFPRGVPPYCIMDPNSCICPAVSYIYSCQNEQLVSAAVTR